ncbi:MAG: hypothetical protein IJF76_00880 [Clostridia bacterium]|nr:hypothetical protein [Clostridia bacterium]
MKVKTLRSILQTGVVLGVVLLLSLAVILIVQFVEIQNLKDEIENKKEQQGQSLSVMVEDYEEFDSGYVFESLIDGELC